MKKIGKVAPRDDAVVAAFYRETGKRVAALRERLGMTRRLFAEMCGLTTSRMWGIEHGTHGLLLETIFAISRATGESMEKLVVGERSTRVRRRNLAPIPEYKDSMRLVHRQTKSARHKELRDEAFERVRLAKMTSPYREPDTRDEYPTAKVETSAAKFIPEPYAVVRVQWPDPRNLRWRGEIGYVESVLDDVFSVRFSQRKSALFHAHELTPVG